MKDNEYEVVLNYIKRAVDNLLVVVDEVKEYGDKNDQRFAAEAVDLMNKVNRLDNKIRFHQRVVTVIAQGDALRAP